MWIVFGFTATGHNWGNENRYCLKCRRTTPHALKAGRVWFSLFFLPLLPLTRLGFAVQCGSCANEIADLARPVPRWTLAPRRKSAIFWGWLLLILGVLLTGFWGLGIVITPPQPDTPDLMGRIVGWLIFVGPLLGLAAYHFWRGRLLATAIAGNTTEALDTAGRTDEELEKFANLALTQSKG